MVSMTLGTRTTQLSPFCMTNSLSLVPNSGRWTCISGGLQMALLGGRTGKRSGHRESHSDSRKYDTDPPKRYPSDRDRKKLRRFNRSARRHAEKGRREQGGWGLRSHVRIIFWLTRFRNLHGRLQSCLRRVDVNVHVAYARKVPQVRHSSLF